MLWGGCSRSAWLVVLCIGGCVGSVWRVHSSSAPINSHEVSSRSCMRSVRRWMEGSCSSSPEHCASFSLPIYRVIVSMSRCHRRLLTTCGMSSSCTHAATKRFANARSDASCITRQRSRWVPATRTMTACDAHGATHAGKRTSILDVPHGCLCCSPWTRS